VRHVGHLPRISSIQFLLNKCYDGVQSQPKHVAVNKINKTCVMCD